PRRGDRLAPRRRPHALRTRGARLRRVRDGRLDVIRIHIPTPLRGYAAQPSTMQVAGHPVGEALQALVPRHGDLRRHLYDEQGRLRRFVNVYRNDEDVRHLEGEATALGERDTITIVPSIAGGADPPREEVAPAPRPASAAGRPGPPARQSGGRRR